MKINLYTSLLYLMIASFSGDLFAQCADASSVYSFNYNNKSYEIVRENKTWHQAAACATERGGYLAEINDEDEQLAIFSKVKMSTIVVPSNTTAFECTPCSFVWIGGNDLGAEGEWVWDGDGDSTGVQFWMGDVNGSPVGGLFNNWGTEPDNSNNQDGLGLGIIHWLLGDAGQWNDLAINNDLYYVIEYDMILGINEKTIENSISIFPNPAQDELTILNNNASILSSIEVYSSLGQKVKTVTVANQSSSTTIEMEDLIPGIYLLNIHFDNKIILSKKVVKK